VRPRTRSKAGTRKAMAVRKAWDGVFTLPVKERVAKPRAIGWTMVMDKGLGVNQTADLMAAAADAIDVVKLTFGTSAFFDAPLLKRKVRLITAAGCYCMPGGTFQEVCVWQGTFDRYLARAEALGFNAIEISDGTIAVDARTRETVIRKAVRAGFRVIPEVGKKDPGEAVPMEALAEEAERDLLAALARTPGNEVYLISGRRRSDLEAWFGDLDLTLVGEHGAWVRNRGSSRWEAAGAKVTSWKDRIRPILQLFVERVPGSFVEEKDFSIAWHYRGSDVESGSSAAKELVDTLTNLTANLDATVLAGNRVVEVASSHANKGHLFASRLADTDWDFILAIGDDSTDEHLFAALPPDAYSIRVGITASAARFNVSGPEGAIALLNGLLMAPRGAKKNPPRRPRLDPVGGAGRGTGTKRSSPQRGLHG